MNAYHARNNALVGTLTDVSDARTIHDVLDLADLDWQVRLRDLHFYPFDEDDVVEVVPDQYAVVRGDTTPLGVVGQRYTPIQNRDAFAPLAYLEAEGFISGYEQAGMLGDGQRVFIIARLAEEMRLVDQHHARILFSTTHDGSGAFSVRAMIQRLFCANQIPRLREQGKSLGISIRHTQSAEQRISQVKHRVMEEMRWIEEYEAGYQRLLDTPARGAGRGEFVEMLAPIPSGPKVTDRMIRTAWRKQQDIMGCINSSANQNIAGTVAALFQGAVEYSDYGARGNNAERILLGRDIEFKRQAWDLALTLSA
jgi:phage/plasmid-like protein (TIGR03299 family)